MITNKKLFEAQDELQHDMDNVADLLRDNRCRFGEGLQAIRGEKGLSVWKSVCASPFLAGRGDDSCHRKGPTGHLGQRWSVCVVAGETGKVHVVKARWGESRWVGGQGGSGADVSRAEDGRASRKDAVPSVPLLQPGAGRGGGENRDKIKLQAGSAQSHAAARAANRHTQTKSFSARLIWAAARKELK